ncbi:hypothetical protein DPMN_161006 [Dreissena polymorpha]|uniref:Uncharacterized protein n=1 Tax=Dreissena polymorpha TaxID=45954 RepID=A0A9D4IT29_DREPO|nr:hypothetical protein DPMN_161006 [Dreissena polymorpha]
MSSPLSIPSNVIFTDDEAAMKNIDNIRPGSVSPLLIRKNDPVIRIVLPVVFVESVALVTSTNVDSFRVKVKRPIDSTLKPVSGGKVGPLT